MDFAIPERMQDVLATIRELLEREVYPLESALISRPFAELVPALAAVRREVQSRGLWAPQLPKSYGGMGLSLLEFALVGEELGRSPLGHYVLNCQAPDAGNMELLREFGTEAQKDALVDAPGTWRVEELLRHDRAGLPRFQPSLDGNARRPRR